ncbi:twin-arginine translocase TatA/TatE family subunit [Mucilaginibacter calamicampi]|uniref:Sec-independent protein translocase protein TatA n=1 Tax=Mucilaginibacter calamicampi TaxID=1302352 RepID=A0ABW2YVS7_9SPHI
MDIGTGELMLILGVALLLFGGDKLPGLARGLGKGIRDFKDASEGVKREINSQIDSFENKKRDEDRKKTTTEKAADDYDGYDPNRFIEEKSAGDEYLGNSIPVSQDHVTATDQVEFEENVEHDTRYKHEQQLPEDEPANAQANSKKIF